MKAVRSPLKNAWNENAGRRSYRETNGPETLFLPDGLLQVPGDGVEHILYVGWADADKRTGRDRNVVRLVYRIHDPDALVFGGGKLHSSVLLSEAHGHGRGLTVDRAAELVDSGIGYVGPDERMVGTYFPDGPLPGRTGNTADE